MQYDDVISYMGKNFNLKISCSADQFPNIKSQLDLKLTPHIQGLIPDNSTLFLEGQDDDTLKIIVLERISGRQYPI